MNEDCYHSVQLTTKQCAMLLGYVEDEYVNLTNRICKLTDSQAEQVNEQLDSLTAIRSQLSEIVSRYQLFDQAVEMVDRRASMSIHYTFGDGSAKSVSVKSYMKNDDCAIYRQYIHTNYGIEPSTIFVIMLRDDGGLTIVDNDDMQSYDVREYNQMVDLLTKFDLI